jgi:superoxide dismutase, Cu-Zn family
MKMKMFAAVSLLTLGLLAPCAQAQEKTKDKGKGKGAPAVTHAVAVMQPTKGSKTKGTVHFTQDGRSVKIKAVIEGLTPNQKHAIHIHEFGDVSAEDGMATGGHYNPEGHQHGLPSAEQRHAGDFGNLQADAQGKVTFELTVDNLTISGPRNPILGRAVIIHAKEDDGGQPTGNAGGRIAQGAIAVAKAP